MPSRVGAGGSNSHGKARYRSKHYYRKSNSNGSNGSAGQRGIPHSNPESRIKPRRPPARLSPQERNVARPNLPPSARYNQRKPWLIWTLEPGNITILRRQDANKPKGNVPSWLADTFVSLPKKHPLKETANDPITMEPMDLTSDDDDNPFAYQPPSPSQAPSTQNLAFPYSAQRGLINIHNASSHRMGLSSIPFAPPIFVEPTYEDHYQDITTLLNDFDNEYEPENHAYLTDKKLSDCVSELISPTRAAPQFISPQRIPSTLFLQRDYTPSPVAIASELHTISSDDTTLPTPTHKNVLSPDTDEIQDALRANHPFVTSIYASSPTGSFRGFPLDTLVGSMESSPRGLASTSRNIPTPDAKHRIFWTPRKELSPQLRVQPRPASSDIYKSRLLAYATAIADHMSSSGDEGLVYQQTTEYVHSPGTGRAASSPVTRNASSLSIHDENSLITLPEDLELFGHSNDYSETPSLYMKSLDPDKWIEPKLAKSIVAGGRDHTIADIQTNSLEPGTSNSDRGDKLDQTDLDDDDLDLVGTYLEDWENGSQSEAAVDHLEEDRPLVSEYEAMQAECDTYAADEPSDDEGGTTEHQVTTPQQGSGIEYSVLEVDKGTSIVPEPPTRDPKVQPFPMKMSRRSPAGDTLGPDKNQPLLTRLPPKFVPQPSRHVRPSPFAALLKKRFKECPSVVGLQDQDGAVVEDKEDEIESWSG